MRKVKRRTQIIREITSIINTNPDRRQAVEYDLRKLKTRTLHSIAKELSIKIEDDPLDAFTDAVDGIIRMLGKIEEEERGDD